MGEKIHGIFTPHVVPLEPNGAINEAGAAPLCRLADRQGRTRAVSQRLDGRVHPLHARRAAADHQDRLRTGGRPRARAGRGRRGQRPRDAARLRDLRRLRRPGGGHRLAVLLQALPRVGLRLFPRDRPAQPDRRDALQHPHVRQPDRRAHHPPAGRVRARSSASRIRRATWPS